MAEEKIIIDFTVRAEDALENIVRAREELLKLKEEQKEVEKSMKDGSATEAMKKRYGEILVEIRELNGTIRDNNKELQNIIKTNTAAEGSLEKLRAQIKEVKTEYESLSAAEREGARGKELIEKMQQLNMQAKEAQLQLQGVPASMSKTVAAMSTMGPMAGRAAAAISKINLAFKALLANPIVLAIAAIVAVIKKLIDSFKKNDEAMTRMQKAFAPLKGLLSMVERGFQAIVNVISKVVEMWGKFYSAIASHIPILKDYVAAQEDIVESTDKLEDAERDYTVNSAKRNAEISELRNKATESEKYTVEERRGFLEKALKLEKEDADEKRQIAQEKLRIAQKQALGEIGYTEMTQEAWDKLSDDQKNTLAQLQADVYNTTTEFNNATRRMTSQLNTFDKDENKKKEDNEKKAAEDAKKRIELERTTLRELEDLTIESMKDLQAKEEKQVQVQTQREIEDIKEKLRTEKDLTEKARQALNQKIILLESNLQVKLGEISKKYNEERIKNRLDAEQKLLEQLIKNADKNMVTYQQILSDMMYDAQIKALDEQINKSTDLKEIDLLSKLVGELKKSKGKARIVIEQEGKDAREAIQQENDNLLKEIEDNRSLGVYYNNEVEKTKIYEQQARNRLAIAQSYLSKIENYTQEERDVIYGSEEKYQNALLKAQNAVVQNQNAVEEAIRNTAAAALQQKQTMIDTYTAIADATGNILNNFQSLFENLAESDEKYSAYAKALAMMQILISTAVSITQAIQGAVQAAAATGPAAPVTTPLFITEMVGIVSGAIASAVGILKKAEKPSKPQFAEGGLVGGITSNRTDDSVDAKLSVGEYVVRSSAVKSLGVDTLNSINNSGRIPQNTFNYEVMRDMLVEAVSQIEPQVSVKEITTLQNRVQIKENISKY